MEIPYTATVRPDTGVTSQTLGMWLFLASEVMLFGSLFSSYALLRSGAASWPDQSSIVNVRLASINTLILIVSSFVIVRAAARLKAGDVGGFRGLMGATSLLGVLFLAIKGVEYRGELLAGLRPATNNFVGLYFVMTSLHALHVMAGVLLNLFLCGPGVAMHRRDAARFTGRVAAAALYWNFIDVIWIMMFVTLYLL
jgi:heme/copper-type cytochrome/quinol oxidase subunit 3